MKFEYDFTGRHSLFSYYFNQEECLDENAWEIIESGSANRNLLPMSVQKEREGYICTYDISGTINMMAWQDGLMQEEQEILEKKIKIAIEDLVKKGIPQKEILKEKQYMYVEIATGEIKLVCIPVKQEEKSDSSVPLEAGGLPLIPPEPKGNLSDEILEKEPDGSNQHSWRDMVLETEDKLWEQGGKPENSVEENLWEKEELLEKPWEKEATQESFGDVMPWEKEENEEKSAEDKRWEQEESVEISEELMPEEDDDSQTVLLRDDGDNETVLLKRTYKIHAELERERTQEVFPITVENCKIGKRALMTDICIRNNPTISREHCVIRFREGEYYIEDMNSSNYTYLNGIRVMPAHPEKLEQGDRIRLSDEEFIFRKES